MTQMVPGDASTWPLYALVLFPLAIFASLDVLSPRAFTCFGKINIDRIPVCEGYSDKLETVDNLCIYANKLLTIPFAYHFIQYITTSPSVAWGVGSMSLKNTLIDFLALVILYDLSYFSFHWLLHRRAIYPFIHKQHHRQRSPCRGNTDGLNAHPVEYIVSAYLHLLAIYIIPTHVVTACAFLAVGAVIGSLNHTRLDIRLGGAAGFLYKASNHDVHHRFPDNNFGQYSSIWDKLFGTYRSYADSDSDSTPTTPDSTITSRKKK
jgi:sterol desaturase/sphingolipid hydroxylase (fatty acid hydroxylase superfamily)